MGDSVKGVCAVCVFPAGGVLLPGRVSGSDSGGGDAHQTGSGQSRAGEVSTVQRHLHRPQERKGRYHYAVIMIIFHPLNVRDMMNE